MAAKAEAWLRREGVRAAVYDAEFEPVFESDDISGRWPSLPILEPPVQPPGASLRSLARARRRDLEHRGGRKAKTGGCQLG